MEKRYIDSLLQEEKYLNELNTMYDEMIIVHRFKRKLDDIEKEVAWFIGNEKTLNIPDYNGFYQHAYKNYIPHVNNTIVQSKYKVLLGEYKVNEIPGYLYCLALLGHLSKNETNFIRTHENSAHELAQEEIENLHVLHSKVKLLIGFLERIDSLVAIFINSIDDRELNYLDDGIKDLDARAIKHRFMTALRTRDKSMAFKLVGRMHDLDEGEDYYFEALSHFISNEYSECIRYINKINKNNIDYSTGIALKLECFSIMGNFSEFIRCIEENIHMEFEFWYIFYLLLSLFLNLNIDEEDFDGISYDILDKITITDEADPYYVGQTYQLIADIITEGLEIIETIDSLSNIISNFEIPEEKLHRLSTLQMCLRLFQDQEDFIKYLDWDYLEGKDINEVKSEAELSLLKLLIDRNPDKSFDNLKSAFIMQYKLGDIEAFINNINLNYQALLMHLSNGEDGAEELIRMAYVEEMLLGNVDSRIKEHIEQQENIDLHQDVDDKRIINLLSTQGKMAYEAAEWQFSKSKEKDYGWKDAGLISLGYYRILEVELNQKFIIPLLSGIGYVALNNEYTQCADSLSGDNKKKYKSKWGTILRTYQEMENSSFQGNGFMIGVLDHFFRAIGSQFEEGDSLASLIKNNLNTILSSYGLEKFEEGFFEGITNEESRNKYRNPPAHTRYLQYSIACECRDIFRKTIIQFGEMLLKS